MVDARHERRVKILVKEGIFFWVERDKVTEQRNRNRDRTSSETTNGGYPTSLAHHHLDEFVIVDLTIAINVSFPDHFFDFILG